MEKKIAGLLGAMAALGTLSAAQATPAPDPTEVLRANSYADLLEPIPNATSLLRAIDESAPAPAAGENVELAQYYYHHHHHHHHHHHGFYGGYRYGGDYDEYGPRVIVVPRYRRYYHHHHHHHHHHSFYRHEY